MKKHLSIILLSLAIVSSSCKKTYLSDLNHNPNIPETSSPSLLLSGALKGAAGIPNGYYSSTAASTASSPIYSQYGCWMGQLTWSPSFQANVQLYSYAFTTSDYNAWTPLYDNIANFNALANSTTEPNYQGIAKIMTVFDYQQLVDNYNDVPYTQALQGTKNLTPKYDKGSDIYDDLMKQLDAAIVMLQKATSSNLNPGANDIVFGGNMTQWIQFANTLKLRLAIRQWTNVPAKQAALKTAITATAALGYIDNSFNASAQPGYLNSDANGGQQSPFWLVYGTSQSGAATTIQQEYKANLYAINYFTNNNDPRLTQIYAPNPDGNLIGTFFGQTSTNPPLQTPSVYGPGLLISATQPAVMMSSSESDFLQAEAVNDGLISGDAPTLYKAGITASFEALQVPDADNAASAYYAQPAIAYPATGTADAKLKAIITQKWAALIGYGFLEVYNEFRRTGYPNDIPLSVFPGVHKPNQPTRIFYPIIEYQTNENNVTAEGTIDPFNTLIFWAKKH